MTHERLKKKRCFHKTTYIRQIWETDGASISGGAMNGGVVEIMVMRLFSRMFVMKNWRRVRYLMAG